MPPKKSASKQSNRKAQAKRANAPMKNASDSKSPRAKKKAEASQAARVMARAVKPGMRKSAAKRVEKEEKRAVQPSLAKQLAQDGFAATRKQANMLIKILKNDATAVSNGSGDETKYRELVLAMSRALTNTKKKHGLPMEY